MLRRLFIILLFVPAYLPAQAETPFFFVQLADPQFGMYPLQKDFRKEKENLSAAIKAINLLKPDFVVVCGDLVNRARDTRQIAAFRKTIAQLDTSIALYLVPGNHDVGNTPTSASLKSYRDNFGPDYYSFERHGKTFVVLNSALLKDPSKVRSEGKKQMDWLADILEKAQRKNSEVIVFEHHPLFVKNAGESSGYFNIPLRSRIELLKLLESHGVSYVFAGHLHRNATGSHSALQMITTGPVGMPLGIDPSGIRIVVVRPTGLEHRYYPLGKIPLTSPLESKSSDRSSK
jgi:3',5'-cyclic AMP phosphodiesterase CpdA